MMNEMVKVSVARGTDSQAMTTQEFDVPYSAGMSVLDALIWIRAHEDPTLALRYSCINANACKECSVMVDGQVEYACTARLPASGVLVEPLSTKTLIRDLVTDIAPTKEHLSKVIVGRR